MAKRYELKVTRQQYDFLVMCHKGFMKTTWLEMTRQWSAFGIWVIGTREQINTLKGLIG